MNLATVTLQLISLFLPATLSSGVSEEDYLIGRIVNTQTNAGIENLVVMLVPPRSASQSNRITTTDRDGNFRFDGLDSNKYLLQVTLGTFLLYRDEVTVPQKSAITIHLTPTGTPTPTATLTPSPPPRDLLRISLSLRDPQLSATLLLYHLNRKYPSRLSPNRDEKIALEDLLWKNGWLPTYNVQEKVQESDAHINDVDISRDGKLLAVALDDHTARIIEMSSGKQLHVLQGHRGPVQSVQFSHGGSAIATASWDGTVKLWDVASGNDRGLHLESPYPLIRVMFNPDDSLLLTKDNASRVTVWSAADGTSKYPLTIANYEVVAFDPAGAILASGQSDGTISFWDAATGHLKGTWRDFDQPIRSLILSGDGRLFATAGYDGGHLNESKLVKVKTNRTIGRYTGDSKQVALDFGVFDVRGKLLLAGSSFSNLKVWDAATRDDIFVLRGHGGWRSGTLMTTDPLKVVVWNKNTIRVLSGEPDELVTEAKRHVRTMSSSECSNYLGMTECPKLDLP